jgi:hypothetical protein
MKSDQTPQKPTVNPTIVARGLAPVGQRSSPKTIERDVPEGMHCQ